MAQTTYRSDLKEDSTLWIVAKDNETQCSLINSVCKRRAPRFLAERIFNIKASSSALILVSGDFKRRLL